MYLIFIQPNTPLHSIYKLSVDGLYRVLYIRGESCRDSDSSLEWRGIPCTNVRSHHWIPQYIHYMWKIELKIQNFNHKLHVISSSRMKHS